MYNCHFSVIKVNHNRLSQKEYIGKCYKPPCIGEQFLMHHSNGRILFTSIVTASISAYGVPKMTYKVLTYSGSEYLIELEKVEEGEKLS
jgi:hypothetical protein